MEEQKNENRLKKCLTDGKYRYIVKVKFVRSYRNIPVTKIRKT